jgi:hypothetical protein
VPVLHGSRNRVNSRAVVVSSIALSKEIGLDRGVLASNPLPINLVKIVRLEDDATNDATSGGGPDNSRDSAKEDVLGGADGRGIISLTDHEVGSIVVVRQ